MLPFLIFKRSPSILVGVWDSGNVLIPITNGGNWEEISPHAKKNIKTLKIQRGEGKKEWAYLPWFDGLLTIHISLVTDNILTYLKNLMTSEYDCGIRRMMQLGTNGLWQETDESSFPDPASWQWIQPRKWNWRSTMSEMEQGAKLFYFA